MHDHSIPIQFVPERVVSLVPSMTESLFDLGFGSSVVGITDYCVHPKEKLTRIPRIGGPKNPRISDILQLNPQLVIANQEENAEESVRALQANGIPVWLTFPTTIDSAIADLWGLARLYRSDHAFITITMLEKYIETLRSANVEDPRNRFFCPIWQDELDGIQWWMTFNRYTYSGDLLELLGGLNVFRDRSRKYPVRADLGLIDGEEPGKRDIRYPRVSEKEISDAKPEFILLPDEPFAFEQHHMEQLQKCFPPGLGCEPKLIRIDGSLIMWPGTRMGKALAQLGELFLN